MKQLVCELLPLPLFLFVVIGIPGLVADWCFTKYPPKREEPIVLIRTVQVGTATCLVTEQPQVGSVSISCMEKE